MEASGFLEAGDRVLVSLDPPPGDPSAKPLFQVYTFRDGRIVRMQDFAKRLKAFRAAGIQA